MDQQADRQQLFTVPPPQPEVVKSGQLSREQVQEFFDEFLPMRKENVAILSEMWGLGSSHNQTGNGAVFSFHPVPKGYLLVKDFFSREELDPCREDVSRLVDSLADELFDAGKIKDKHEGENIDTRLIEIDKQFPGAAILLMKRGIFPKSFQELWTNERLLNMVEQLIGPDIMGHPVWNLRSKIPQHVATVVPWHQDAAYMDEDALDVLQLTAWIPFVNATEENGTLQMVRRGHRTARLAKHTCCYSGTWYVDVEPEEMEKTLGVNMATDVETIEVPYGSLLLFNNLLPHQSLPNVSDITRWAIDLRWQDPKKKVGFHDIKPGIVFRTREDLNPEPDFDKFNSYNRSKIQLENLGMEEEAVDPFDTTMSGPWMKKWEIVSHNRHTRSYTDDEPTWNARA